MNIRNGPVSFVSTRPWQTVPSVPRTLRVWVDGRTGIVVGQGPPSSTVERWSFQEALIRRLLPLEGRLTPVGPPPVVLAESLETEWVPTRPCVTEDTLQ